MDRAARPKRDPVTPRPGQTTRWAFDLDVLEQSDVWVTPSGRIEAIEDLTVAELEEVIAYLRRHGTVFYVATLRALVGRRLLEVTGMAEPSSMLAALTSPVSEGPEPAQQGDAGTARGSREAKLDGPRGSSQRRPESPALGVVDNGSGGGSRSAWETPVDARYLSAWAALGLRPPEWLESRPLLRALVQARQQAP